MDHAGVSHQAIDAIGYVGGALLAGCFLPQIYQVISTRSVHDISISWSLLYNSGLTLTTVYLMFKDAPAAWIPSLFELVGGLLVLLLKLFFDHTATGRKMCAARLQQQLQEQQEQEQEQQQQGKDGIERPTLDAHLDSVFSDDSAANSQCVVVQMKDVELTRSGSGASSPTPSSPQSRPQNGPHKGLILRLPTQKSGVNIRSAYPLSPLACQTFKPALSKSVSRHFSSPGSFREHAAAHAAQQGAGERQSNLGLNRHQSATEGSFKEHAVVHSPRTPRAVGRLLWSSISEGGAKLSQKEGDKAEKEKP